MKLLLRAADNAGSMIDIELISMGTSAPRLVKYLVILICLLYLGSLERLTASILPVLSQADDLISWAQKNGGQVNPLIGQFTYSTHHAQPLGLSDDQGSCWSSGWLSCGQC